MEDLPLVGSRDASIEGLIEGWEWHCPETLPGVTFILVNRLSNVSDWLSNVVATGRKRTVDFSHRGDWVDVKVFAEWNWLERLGIFAKYWEVGKVKTRLARSIGPMAARDIYHLFLNHLLQRHADSAHQLTLAYSPPEKREAFAELGHSRWSLEPQCGGDLGGRMHGFFEHAFRSTERPEKVVLIGSDSPQLSVAMIRQAFDALNDHEVTIGPCPDGGYYLIGMKGQAFNLFQGIDWSSEFVFDQTNVLLEQLGLSFKVLAPLLDVDHLEDLDQLVNEFDDQCELDPLDQKLLRDIKTILGDATGEKR